MVLADVNINESPDLSYIQEFVDINENTQKVYENISNSLNMEEIVQNVKMLENVLSDEAVCIGIHANTSYVICKKELNTFSEIAYMNIFGNLLNKE